MRQGALRISSTFFLREVANFSQSRYLFVGNIHLGSCSCCFFVSGSVTFHGDA
jgi:hypothetical protein